MSSSFKMNGFKELEQALAQLPAGTAKGVVRRSLKKELKPIQDMANAFWPGADNDAFVVASKIKRSQLGDSGVKFGRSVVNMFVGTDQHTPHGHLIEFGTAPRYHKRSGKYVGAVSPLPMLQPAWDAHRYQLLEGLGARIWEELEKTIARREAKLAKQGGA